MKTRSSDGWSCKPGSFDKLKTSLIDFDGDYPVIGSTHISSIKKIVASNYSTQRVLKDCTISMFIDDYALERYFNNPIKYVSLFSECSSVMTPDYSLLINMPKPMQMWQVYRNRFVGYIWERNGIKVIPTVSWSNEDSFEYAFNGIKKHSVVAVSNIGCRNDNQKSFFDNGLNAMIDVIKPTKIVFQCNNKYKSYYDFYNFEFIKSYWDSK